MMKTSNTLISSFGFLFILSLSGCSGLKFWQKGDFFQMTLQEDFDPATVRKVGVYVFSEGEQRDAVRSSIMTVRDGIDVAENILAIPLMFLSVGGIGIRGYFMGTGRFDKEFYPPKMKKDARFKPDTANSGPSFELASGIRSELNDRGYRAEVFTDLGHDGVVHVQDCLTHAKMQGMDAAFIVCYRGINRWQRFNGYEHTHDTVPLFKLWTGFLYLPHSGFFNVKTEEMIWSNNYYGIVEEAHVMNFADEEFTEVVSEAIIENGGKTYFEAVPPALEMIFAPKYWPKSQKPFPSRREKGAGGSF